MIQEPELRVRHTVKCRSDPVNILFLEGLKPRNCAFDFAKLKTVTTLLVAVYHQCMAKPIAIGVRR